MFKVGDWVTHGKELHQILEVEKGYVKASNLGELSNCWINESKFNLWKPKVGEWCWFWCHNTDVPNFMMFSHITEDNLYVGNVCKGGADIEFDYCEPFIGKLPSFIKG